MNICRKFNFNYYILFFIASLAPLGFLDAFSILISREDYENKSYMLISSGDILMERSEKTSSKEDLQTSLREFIFIKASSKAIVLSSRVYSDGNKGKHPDSVTPITISINNDFTFIIDDIKFVIYKLKRKQMVFSISK